MLKSIATVSLSGTLPEKLDTAAAIGFDGVEIFENDLLTFDGSPQDVRRIADGLGLAIYCFQPFRDFEAMPAPARSRNLDRAERKFDVAQALGTDLVLVCSNVQPAAIDDDARAAADLAEMAERAARRGLRVGYEALAWGRHVSRWSHAWRIVQAAGHKALGLVLDSFHTLAVGDNIAGVREVPGEKIFLVQVADAPKLSLDALSWSRHFRNFPGQGGLDVAGFVRAVVAAGYQGPLSLEVFNDDFRAAPARLTARDGLRSLLYVEAEAGAAKLPSAARLKGFEFVEFAVDAASGAELARFLEVLGFRPAGVHRSKDVRLYRCGGVSLVLNSEQDSAASEYFHLHGPSVCALALRVDDAGQALARARALLCPEWQERIGPGERRIPAVRAPDGTLICLVEDGSIWGADFELAEDAGGGGLARIDHVAQSLPVGRMDSFILFYRSVFGLKPEELWELPDPYGLIRSRAVSSSDGAVRLPLNISESRETATGRFVSEAAGAGVQHIAFATDDIAAFVGRMRAAGGRMLSVPGNYYDDVAARWGLSVEEAAALRDLDLLFDRDEGGDFRHAYTVSFADRFFFEVVERHGYRGYGAVNAGVRIAAQTAARVGAGIEVRI
jgi:4-hydroxyphenylpyruvate dioxygenase